MAMEAFDFVIVGGGTAGLVVGSRAAQTNAFPSVRVLEAGNDLTEGPRVLTPALYSTLLSTDADWAFPTEPQAVVLVNKSIKPGFNERPTKLNQGMLLGGSSAINAQVLVPPSPWVVDTWAELGNPGWDWEAMKPYFEKPFQYPLVEEELESALGLDNWNQDGVPVGATSGPPKLSFPGDAKHPLRKAWADTFKSLGHTTMNIPYDEAMTGAFSNLVTTDPDTKQRTYAASAYLAAAKPRPDFVVRTGALVEKIIFRDDDDDDSDDSNSNKNKKKKAVGVQYSLDGETRIATALKEVVLAAGALQSPKILEVSGVGKAELVESLGLELIQHLPGVGENLQDHVVCGLSFEAADGVDTLDAILRQEPVALGKAMDEYANNRSGPLISVGIDTYAYLATLEDEADGGREALKRLLDQERPSCGDKRASAYFNIAYEALLNPAKASGTTFGYSAQGPVSQDSASEVLPSQPVPGNWITIGVILSHPISTGFIRARSANVSDAPLVSPQYLTNPVVLEIYARHLLYVQTIAAASPMAAVLKQPLNWRDAASRLTDIESAKAWASSTGNSIWHLCGSCAMLPRELGGVVDPELRVYGVGHLHVVDSSAIPRISTGNLQHAVYAFAERAADLIIKTHSLN